jgi:hypothetical protein
MVIWDVGCKSYRNGLDLFDTKPKLLTTLSFRMRKVSRVLRVTLGVADDKWGTA